MVQDRAWREFLGSPSRVSAPNDSLQSDPQPVWRASLGRGLIGAPAVSEDVLAVSLVDRQVALLDRATGEVLWKRGLGQHLGSGPLLSDDRLLVATQDDRGRVHALRLTDGRTLWSASSGDVAAPLLVDRGAIVAASLEGTVSRFDVRDGTRRWRSAVPGAVRAAPVALPRGVIVATTTDSLLLLDRGDGRIMARRATPGTVLGAPALADSLLLIGTTAGRLEALDTATLERRWVLELDGGVVGHVAARQSRAFVVTTAGTLWMIPLERPAAAARVATGLVLRAGPVPVANGVLVGGVNGELVLLGYDGRRRWSARLGSPLFDPVIVDGSTVFAAGRRGQVVAFR